MKFGGHGKEVAKKLREVAEEGLERGVCRG